MSINKRKGLFRLIYFITIICICAAFFAAVSSKAAIADENPDFTKSYKSVFIREGDSLYSIADDYYSSKYSDLNELIAEIKSINNLSSDIIYAGANIIVPVYTLN